MSDNTPESAVPTQPTGRRCTATSKKTGERCTAYCVEGTDKCAGHGASREHLLKARQRSAEVRKTIVEERPKSLKDAVAKRLEARADKIAAMIDSDIERLDSGSVRAWMEQAYGKPQQTVISEESSKPADAMTLAELERARAALLRDSNVTDLRKPASQAG